MDVRAGMRAGQLPESMRTPGTQCKPMHRAGTIKLLQLVRALIQVASLKG